MKSKIFACGVGLLLAAAASQALADDVEGQIESLDAANQTVKVQGFEFAVNQDTDFDDDVEKFEDLKVGQEVEVDFEYREGKHVALEIEGDD